MYPILFSIGKINFYSYGFFASLAFIAGYLVIYQLFKKDGHKTDDLVDKCLLIFIAAVLVSRLAFYLVYHDQFNHWYELFYIWQGGMISFGGLLGGLISYGYFYKKNLWHNF